MEESHCWADPRLHAGRLREKFGPSHVVAHSFPLIHLLPFAQDTVDNVWLAWHAEKLKDEDPTVYAFDEQPRAPPPRKVQSIIVLPTSLIVALLKSAA